LSIRPSTLNLQSMGIIRAKNSLLAATPHVDEVLRSSPFEFDTTVPGAQVRLSTTYREAVQLPFHFAPTYDEDQ